MLMGSCLYKNVTVFLDRDGTLNHDIGYLTSPEELILFDGVLEAIARLKESGSRLVLVTNQSAIGRGQMNLADLERIHRHLADMLLTKGIRFDGIFFCPHHPDAGCYCRKPNPGLIEQAVSRLGVDVRRSYVVGDKCIDMELAQNVGAIGVLVTTSLFSREALRAIEAGRLRVEKVAATLLEAADWIIHDVRHRVWA
ncbi:MAG: HAD family hydrolase [Nitrospirae bacterium]|nr:MAG: HAD family hydrolase [Nitrospirota bacterium]